MHRDDSHDLSAKRPLRKLALLQLWLLLSLTSMSSKFNVYVIFPQVFPLTYLSIVVKFMITPF